MRRVRQVVVTLLLTALLGGCWDRAEVEDQLFPVTVAVDAGTSRRYRVTLRVPIPGEVRSGMLGGQAGKTGATGGILSAESDSVAQAVLIINASVARRLTMRHMRTLLIGEDVARTGMHDLFAELMRSSEVRQTVAFLVCRGRCVDVIKASRYTGESNPAKVPEGMLIVAKYLHLAPPIRLHHMINRSAGVGVDAFAPVVAINQKVGGEPPEEGLESETALAGELDRFDGNPVEVAGTAVFRGRRMVGLLTVDETQALLALRGEMGKAYMTFPHPKDQAKRVLVRFQQENKPMTRVRLTPAGPRGNVNLLFEGEVLSGDEDYQDAAKRQALEKAAAEFMVETATGVLRKLKRWEADPVGYGLKVRRTFRTWSDWEAFGWARHIGQMEIRVTAKMRVRRFGLVTGTEQIKQIQPGE
ncbi:MAG: hypothetical protein K0R39_821 [Symbiobacteriaceae bacterium]|jgi:Ger(x)C family germination protein|nr:hypothetical protein [Symbiobacteriaceae bacterium]